ncbi:MAG: glutamine synthetase III [Candidatus Obscuribacterales bacterium]|nr:glutamine synthetase III [Candidatus Obscuribacterales bacterium]
MSNSVANYKAAGSTMQSQSGNGANRQRAINTIQDRQPVKSSTDYSKSHVADLFGSNVFNRSTMRQLLPKAVYKAVVRCLDYNESLDPSLADVVANAMKDWAIARGATHYTHWFMPMTGSTAEKHDSFLVTTGDDGAILEFSGKTLIQGEPDASSFPSGGIRSTFEARGYTGWDATSPAFIMESINGKTLCIPTVFCSYSGHALDKKTPLLRSIDAVNKQGVRLLKLLGHQNVKRVSCTVGPEQEYFLVDESFHLLRPDLINCGRALFGARPPKGQEMEDHYWGSIRERVLSFMMDAESELYKLGVPVKTRHNEVAPAQFEVAPVFESSNIATDHNMVLMEVFGKTAQKHGFRCLFHEKPFSGVNGSGKHNNWSLADDSGNNLLEPGKTPSENTQFLVVLSAVIRCVNKYGALLRACIATAGNDHRLGANEAPPAIMSIYLGDKLLDVVNAIIHGRPLTPSASSTLQIGVSTLPELPRDDSDRNRTSPFAFTGNKFEFRAVGASQSIGWPNTVLNTMAAESLDYVCSKIESELKSSKDLNAAVQKVVKEVLTENERIIFNGDNYSKEWHEEAARRGLPNLRNTVEALPVLVSKEAMELFTRYQVLSEDELTSRYNVMLESYCKTINIEAQLTKTIGLTMILPAALDYQTKIATSIAQCKAAMPSLELAPQEKLLKEVAERINRLKLNLEHLDAISHEVDEGESDLLSHARFYQEKVIPAMNNTRATADELEMLVDDSMWPLPKFREMLYIY